MEINNNNKNNITENTDAVRSGAAAMPEFVGTTVLDTIGLVIASVDEHLREKMNINGRYKSVGIISSRTGAAGQKSYLSCFRATQRAGAVTETISS